MLMLNGVVFSLYLNLDIINCMAGLYELFTKKAGIEKRALNAAQLINMAQNFARRGKLNRFETLLKKREKALENVQGSRMATADDLADRAYQEWDLLGGPVGPEFLKYEKARSRVPVVSMASLYKNLANKDSSLTRLLYFPNPTEGATLDSISDTVRRLRKNYPGELERINNPEIRKSEADGWIQQIFRS